MLVQACARNEIQTSLHWIRDVFCLGPPAPKVLRSDTKAVCCKGRCEQMHGTGQGSRRGSGTGTPLCACATLLLQHAMCASQPQRRLLDAGGQSAGTSNMVIRGSAIRGEEESTIVVWENCCWNCQHPCQKKTIKNKTKISDCALTFCIAEPEFETRVGWARQTRHQRRRTG